MLGGRKHPQHLDFSLVDDFFETPEGNLQPHLYSLSNIANDVLDDMDLCLVLVVCQIQILRTSAA